MSQKEGQATGPHTESNILENHRFCRMNIVCHHGAQRKGFASDIHHERGNEVFELNSDHSAALPDVVSAHRKVLDNSQQVSFTSPS